MSGIAEYFNLNKPVFTPPSSDTSPAKAGKHMATRTKAAGEKKEKAKDRIIPWWEQLIMFLGIGLGVSLSEAIKLYASGEPFTVTVTLATVIPSLLIALIVMPYAYDRLKISAQGPFMVRLGLFVQNGVFWNVLFDLIK